MYYAIDLFVKKGKLSKLWSVQCVRGGECSVGESAVVLHRSHRSKRARFYWLWLGRLFFWPTRPPASLLGLVSQARRHRSSESEQAGHHGQRCSRDVVRPLPVVDQPRGLPLLPLFIDTRLGPRANAAFYSGSCCLLLPRLFFTITARTFTTRQLRWRCPRRAPCSG